MRAELRRRIASVGALAVISALSACRDQGSSAATTGQADSVRRGIRAVVSGDSARRVRTASTWLALSDDSATIGAHTADRMLDSMFGAANVRRERVEIGEGETLPATVLFPDDSARRLEILWVDTVARDRPAHFRIGGTRSEWFAGGVSAGTSLTDLERINGRPFVMTGFGWDYAGTITSWNGGRLDSLPPGVERLVVRLYPARDAVSDSLKQYVAGDRDFPSTNPILQRLNPRAYAVEVWFEK